MEKPEEVPCRRIGRVKVSSELICEMFLKFGENHRVMQARMVATLPNCVELMVEGPKMPLCNEGDVPKLVVPSYTRREDKTESALESIEVFDGS